VNSLIHGLPFCVNIYTSYKLSKMYSFYWATLYIIRVTASFSAVTALRHHENIYSRYCVIRAILVLCDIHLWMLGVIKLFYGI